MCRSSRYTPPAPAQAPGVDQPTGRSLAALGHEPMPVLAGIRAKCLDCSGGSHAEVADCLVKNCAVYPFRMGKNPWRAELSAEQRAERAAHLRRPNAGKNVPCHGGLVATAEAATT